MTLKEKLEIIKNYDDQDPYETFMGITDEYAIEFANWLLTEPFDVSFKGKNLKNLLEEFKKQKGL